MLTRIRLLHSGFVSCVVTKLKLLPHPRLLLCLLIGALVVSAWGISRVSAVRQVASVGASSSLSEFLNPDGTLDLSRGFQGSLNPQGFRLEYAENGAPRFVAAEPAIAAGWDTQFVNANGAQTFGSALAVIGTDVYLGGTLSSVGNVVVSGIAKWDGSTWSTLGSGVNGSVFALAASGTDLYVAGDFSMAGGISANNVAKWDGSSWSALGSGVSGGSSDYALSVAVSGSDVYVGGKFTTAGGNPAANIARWNGSAWSALGSGTNQQVVAVAVSGSNVYAGGEFTTAGGNPANYVARWNGSAWSALGSGMDFGVTSLAVSGTDLYAGGVFSTAGGVSASSIARWNGSAWSALGSGMLPGGFGSVVRSIVIVGANLYATGSFDTAGGTPANSISCWNGSAWSALGSGLVNGGLSAEVAHSIAALGSELYVAGIFSKAGGNEANLIARWNGSAWSPLGNTSNSVNRAVRAIAINGNDVYVGGEFDFAGGIAANKIAKWNGSSWSALGSGITSAISVVTALAVSGNDVYVAGVFTHAGGNPADNIARWNGSAWSAVGSGLSGEFHAVAVIGTNVYVGGSFLSVGGGLARWDGSSWSAVGGDVLGRVYALAVSGSDLYAGGTFFQAGGVFADGVARWNGSTWSALGSGIIGAVYALAINGTDLYAGGTFTTAGGSPANRIARWNGSAWSALGSGLSGGSQPRVTSIAILNNDIFVGGRFTTAGGNPASQIAKWNGSVWSNLGGGTNGIVNALGIRGLDVMAGGSFTTADSNISHFFARFDTNTLPTITAGGPLARQAGSVGASDTIAVVSDTETAAGSLTVTATTVPTGITVTGITNSSGTVSATVAAACNATVGANIVVLTVTDGNSGTATANLTVNVTAATAPTTSNAGPDQMLCATAPATLAANAPSIGTGAWSIVSGPSLSPGQFNSLTNPTATFTPAGGAGAYTLRWTITGVCATSTDDVVLTYNALPTITLGASPSVLPGITITNLTYSATSGSPNQYGIDYDSTANAAGFTDVTNATLTASPIVLTVPGAGDPAIYNATLTVRNSTTGCVSSSTAFTVTIANCPSLFTVNDPGDAVDASPGNGVCATAGGVCTLRAAIQEANVLTACSPITINFSVTGTITLGSNLPSINHPNLTITGPGANSLTVSGANSFRPFRIGIGKTVAISGLTVANGFHASQAGGIQNNGTLTMTDCAVTGNTSPQAGGIQNDSVLTMTGCTISGNTATSQNGGGLVVFGNTTLTNCTFSGNHADDNGGGISLSGELVMTNCTVTNNTTSLTTGEGGGLYIGSSLLNVTLKNTVVIGNSSASGSTTPNVSTLGNFQAGSSNNLLGVGDVGGLTNGVNGNQIGVAAANAPLATLGNYGGATQTHALLPGNPAINAGTASGAPATDQRGIARVGNVDIGAFESRGFTLATGGGDNQSAVTNTAFASPLGVTVTSANGEPVNGGRVMFTPPGSGAGCTLATNPATIVGGAASSTATANAIIGGPYTVSAVAAGATPAINFSLTNLNSAPTFTPAAAALRQQGSPAGAAVTVGTVSDAQSAAGSLTVTQTAGGTATGITVSGITNTGGTITAVITADCTAVGGTVSFQVSDGNLTGTGNLQVNVSSNTAPTLAYGNVAVNAGSATTNSPTTATDNGNINSFAVQSQGGYTGTISVNTSGVVAVSNAAPVGNHTITIRATDNCDSTTDAQFTLMVNNNAPTITPSAALTRQQGTAGTVGTIATVNDGETPVGSLVVTATTVPTGITVTSITNNAGTVTANVAAGCNAAVGANTVVLTVTDANSGTATANLTVNVSANTAPSLSYPISGVALNSATTINPTTATDNGSITGHQIVSVTPPLTVAPTVNASGVVSVTNAAPFGLHSITVRATDNCGATTDVQFTLNVGCGSLTVTPATLVNGLTFVPYSSTLSATGGSGTYTFSLTSGTLPAGLNLSGNTISGTPNTAGASTFTIRATDDNGCFGEQSYTLLIGSTGLKYYPLARPVRLLDTRPGLSPNACFQPNAPIPGGTSRLQPARGVCEGLTIPANATTITGNITTVQSGGGFLTIYPSDAPQPLVANSNYQPNEILNNAFTVGVGAQDGAVKIFVTSTTDVVVDVTGYYAPPQAGGLYFHPLPRPVRLLETRSGFSGCFTPGTPLSGGANTPQLGTGSCQGLTIPPDALALVGNATTVNPTGEGYLTLYPANAAQPLIASSNYAAGQVVNGPFTVGLSPSGQFNIFTLATTDLVVDITGYYSAQANDANGQGLLFTSLGSPLRLLDTRAGEQGCYTPEAAMTTGTVYTQETQSPCTNLTPTARALIGNATVVNTTGEGYLTFWPADATQPLVATSNYVAGQVFNRYFTVGLSGSVSFKRFASRTTDLVIDISGFFAP